ncbi:hypothetical protein H0G86_001303 [Trichoderma simmonsii]|uniref:Uncharacterized protein n=1 Tax=Trichoderma simmonsii TaxID=1491479 RepID=A0A8G0L4E3_9HYPO|nr:hypothetical protein H0G86_001303 [Trichoderma simmonsii]
MPCEKKRSNGLQQAKKDGPWGKQTGRNLVKTGGLEASSRRFAWVTCHNSCPCVQPTWGQLIVSFLPPSRGDGDASPQNNRSTSCRRGSTRHEHDPNVLVELQAKDWRGLESFPKRV